MSDELLEISGEDDPRARQEREVEEELRSWDEQQLFLNNSLATPGCRVYHGQHRSNEMDDTNIDPHPSRSQR